MKTLVTANQKGGVGKTAGIVHLAFDFVERGLKVVVIDLDPQANASFTLKDYQTGLLASQLFGASAKPWPETAPDHTDGPRIALVAADAALANLETMPIGQAGAAFRNSIALLAAQGFDVCLIDTAPSLGVRMAAALLSADYVLSPIELEAYSIQGIKQMMTTIANIRIANPKIKFLGMVASKVDARNPRHVRHQDELRQAYPKLMIPVSVGLRSSIADALASGVPVWTIKRTAARVAAEEVRALAEYVFEKMEIEQ